MSNVARVLGAGGNTQGIPLNVEDVFSTFLYDGTGSTQTITNNVDLGGEGGLVWTKSRSHARNHSLHDSARGVTCLLKSNATNDQYCDATQMVSFNSNGFTVGSDGSSNTNGDDYVSWSFRKAPKFFDCVQFTGSATTVTIQHNLGVEPGLVIVKKVSTTSNWFVSHRFSPNNGWPDGYYLNTTGSVRDSDGRVSNATASSIDCFTGSDGATYVAYIFAHNDGDGEFGPNGNADIIKCGSYSGQSSADIDIDLGFEPQWLLVKRTDGSGSPAWWIADVMRGWNSDGISRLEAQSNSAEQNPYGNIRPTATGFHIPNGNVLNDASSSRYIYMAIRRGPQATPTDATKVFHIHNQSGSYSSPIDVGFTTDLSVMSARNGQSLNATVGDRLRRVKFLSTSQNNADDTGITWQWDLQNKFQSTWTTNTISWMWKRAPGYFDMVAYTGNGTAGRTVSHNLGVAPEMMWVKERSGASNWSVYHSDLGNDKVMFLNIANSVFTSGIDNWATTTPTSSVFSLGASSATNNSNDTYIAYLFASCPGVSKVGSYTGTGQSGGDINVDCGFTSGARFILIKRRDASGSWWIADTVRGIVSGNEPLLGLDSTSAELTGYNMVKPYSSGFIVNGSGGGDNSWNDAGGKYIFYAIA